MLSHLKKLVPTAARRHLKSCYKWVFSSRSRLRLFSHCHDYGVFLSSIDIRRIDDFLVAYRPDTSDESVLKHSFDRDIFFPGVPEYEPKQGHAILDIGAHIG